MSLPADAGLARKDSVEDTPIGNEHADGEQDPKKGSLDDSPGKQKSEIAEDQTAGADVIAVTGSGDPDPEATGNDDEDRGAEEYAASTSHDESAENQEGQRVGNEVSKIAVQERGQRDAAQASDRARSDPVRIKLHDRHEEIEDFDEPHCSDHDSQQQGMVAQGRK